MVVFGNCELHTTRPFAAGPFVFALAASDSTDARLIGSLFEDLASPLDDRVATVFVLLRLKGDDGEVRWSLSGPRLADEVVGSLSAVLVRLMSAINLCALDADPGRLHLHAALATKDGLAALLAAERDVGKTTTIAHLVVRGWTFLTDETVSVEPDAHHLSGFPKPLSIKPGGRELVEHLTPWMVPPVDDGLEAFRFVRAGATAEVGTDAVRCHLIVLLRPRHGGGTAAPASCPLHPADAVVGLMQETLDAERFGATTARLATLTAASHCFEVTLGGPADTAGLIEELFDLAPVEPLDVRVLPESGATTPGVVTVTIGDRAVVHEQRSGRIFALDAAGTRVWEHLGGWSVDPAIDRSGPGIAPFVAQLRALGVLDGSAA